ncbi:MAG: MGMT family protein [Pseudomonadota bacterium]|nr:MGMT family protein [Pseudomonadota bacterium]
MNQARTHTEPRLDARGPSRNPGYAHTYAVVQKIPAGKVATYGQIAALAGMPRQARQVGYALHTLNDESGVPWQRVINAKGEVSPRTWSENHLLQRILLEDEGIEFDDHGRVDLTRFGWAPDSA